MTPRRDSPGRVARFRRCRRGAVAIEAALILPTFFLTLLGAFSLMNYLQATRDAQRVAAGVATITARADGLCRGGGAPGPNRTDVDDIVEAADIMAGGGIDLDGTDGGVVIVGLEIRPDGGGGAEIVPVWREGAGQTGDLGLSDVPIGSAVGSPPLSDLADNPADAVAAGQSVIAAEAGLTRTAVSTLGLGLFDGGDFPVNLYTGERTRFSALGTGEASSGDDGVQTC